MTLLAPTAEQEKQMNSELSQDPELTREDVQRLREWLAKQPHLPDTMDDARLEHLLYGCKFSLERAKHILDSYYTVRAGVPELFGTRDPLDAAIQDSFRHLLYAVMPRLTPEGYRVTMLRLATPDAAHLDVAVAARRILMVLDVRLNEERCLNNVMVFDLSNFTAHHFTRVMPTLRVMRQAMICIQDAFPMRIHQVHFLNVPSFMGKVLAAFTPLLKEKLVKKFFIHTNGYDSFYEYVPRDILPKEYGGEAGTLRDLSDAWAEKLESNRAWLMEEARHSKADETRRPIKGSTKTTLAICDLEGSFRKLNID